MCEHHDLFVWHTDRMSFYWCRRCGALALAGSVIGIDTKFTIPDQTNPPPEMADNQLRALDKG